LHAWPTARVIALNKQRAFNFKKIRVGTGWNYGQATENQPDRRGPKHPGTARYGKV
jgi:hypothetical protein